MKQEGKSPLILLGKIKKSPFKQTKHNIYQKQKG